MAITLDELTAAPGDLDVAALLGDWDWLLGEPAQPLLLTVAGDAFLQLQQTPGVFFLDCAQGVLELIADDVPEFLQRLGDADFVAACFRFDLVAPRIRAGETPPHGQVFGLRVPLPLGGQLEPGNLELADIAVHFALTGQLHAQVAASAPGQAVADISLATE